MNKGTNSKTELQNQQDFVISIISGWSTNGVKYNKGNINILKYAFITQVAWALHRNENVSQRIINQYLENLQGSLWIIPVIVDPSQLYLKF